VVESGLWLVMVSDLLGADPGCYSLLWTIYYSRVDDVSELVFDDSRHRREKE